MKPFRFANIHFLLIGVLCFGVLATAINLLSSQAMLLLLAFFVVASFVTLLIYQNKIYVLDELDKIKYVNDQAENSMTSLLENMPVGVIKMNASEDEVEWFNPFAEMIFTKEDGEFDHARFKEIVTVGLDKSRIYAHFSGKRYIVHSDEANHLFYFFDVSSEYKATQEVTSLRPVIGVIGVDNYDDLEDTISDSDISQVNSFIANFVTEFTDRHQIFYRRVGMDRFYLVTDYGVLEQLIDDKFSVINQFRAAAKELEIPLTLSMGYAYGSHDHSAIGQLAIQNLNMAEVRGGDQVVIQENGENKAPMYFGGNTASTVKRTRTRTRAMMSAISDKIRSSDKVFVVGHCHLDMDALGSAIGMQHFAKNIMPEAYTVYDDKDMFSDIEKAIQRLHEEETENLITVSEAMDKVTAESLLIMVDHSKISLTLSNDFYEQFSQVVVVDHHRRDSDFPENAVISYIESGASSASELVTELLQFQKSDRNQRLTRLEASLLMAGIMLDTKNFTSRVTSRTFDVASYLRSCGSDSVEIQNISATDFDEYREVNELILKGQRVRPEVIIAKADEQVVYDRVLASKAADTMLTMSGIEAAFVICRTQEDEVAISARSRNKINVQKIMEDMGGGGHFGQAAAQIKDQTLDQVYETLTDIISKLTIKEPNKD
ncbi:DHH family phosphoesterase [Streptococcus moroccensis]|uniref:Cyclic-di-AMP phosphodiesterase n=1 Tax=Streptococcus moroccensis TaxID=1451356 RepID=A0ABT9YRP7_9STRE|nr:DHH family phosphoesterase [Streptococcus moroccensis]MDQ0222572.1 c-di-AMP phosphodiesterase-like protein [Streptococcus moroccensis]